MPIFEYQCKDCGKKHEILHLSSSRSEEAECPFCGSKENKKLLSSFNANVKEGSKSHRNFESPCSSGACGMPDNFGSCPTGGSCGLN